MDTCPLADCAAGGSFTRAVPPTHPSAFRIKVQAKTAEYQGALWPIRFASHWLRDSNAANNAPGNVSKGTHVSGRFVGVASGLHLFT